MKILYFAWLRERIGKDFEDLQLPNDVQTVSELTQWLSQKDEGYRAALGDRKNLKVAVNQTVVKWDHQIANDDEVAFFPPMTGG